MRGAANGGFVIVGVDGPWMIRVRAWQRPFSLLIVETRARYGVWLASVRHIFGIGEALPRDAGGSDTHATRALPSETCERDVEKASAWGKERMLI